MATVYRQYPVTAADPASKLVLATQHNIPDANHLDYGSRLDTTSNPAAISSRAFARVL